MATSYSAERDRDNGGEDYINGLPDDILLTMLSPMGFKEAAKTSILSKRWRNLWAQRTHLDFNHLVVLPESDPDVENIDSVTAGQKSKYINWVNQVVDLNCYEWIDTFRVCFQFDSNDAHHIHKWVKFALSKKVENLELDLVSYEHEPVYSIGLDILKPPSSLVDNGIGFLKTLHFCKIDVSGDFLEYLLSHCCLLERIYVEGSRTLVRWKVTDLSCKLKQLTIRYCNDLEELEIDAVNLIHLECNDIKYNANVVFKSLPMLVEATFGGSCLKTPASILQHLSHPFWAQISKLSLDVEFGEIPTGVLPTFCNLKQLNLVVAAYVVFDLVAITHFLKACPLLREFELKIEWFGVDDKVEATELKKLDLAGENVVGYNLFVEAGFGWNYFYSVADIEPTTHPNLKLLKVVGFKGSNYDVDFILFLAVLASNLETIVCDPNSGIVYWKFPEEVIEEASRSRAAKLAKLIPPKISLVIM